MISKFVCNDVETQDRIWEIEKSWRNNLVFHGILYDDPNVDEPPHRTEEKVMHQSRTIRSISSIK